MTDKFNQHRRELDSYNVFFSAVKGRNADQSLYDLGYRETGRFRSISDNRNEVEPDFTLYNNEILLLVEIKSGNSIRERGPDQLERASDISIEAGRSFLNEANKLDPLLDPNELTDIQPLIVYPKETIESCYESEDCISKMENMGQNGGILSQEKGEVLQLEEGSIDNSGLKAVLNSGINIPKHPETNVYLTDNVGREILAYSICMDMIRPQFSTSDEIVVEIDDVYERYPGRKIPNRKVKDAFEFLNEINACSRTDTNSYLFLESNHQNIMSVTEKLEEKTVKEWLGGDTDTQRSLDEYIEEGSTTNED